MTASWWGDGKPKKTPRAPRAKRRRKCCQTPCPVHDAPPPWWSGLHPGLRHAAALGFTLEGRPDPATEWDAAFRWAEGPGVTLRDLGEAAARSMTPTQARDAVAPLRARWKVGGA